MTLADFEVALIVLRNQYYSTICVMIKKKKVYLLAVNVQEQNFSIPAFYLNSSKRCKILKLKKKS